MILRTLLHSYYKKLSITLGYYSNTRTKQDGNVLNELIYLIISNSCICTKSIQF